MKRMGLIGLLVMLVVAWGACSDDAATGNENNNNVTPGCGNGIVEPDIGEACDDGAANSDTEPNACRTSCQNPSCGDGVQDNGEDCDGDDLDGAICSDLPPLNHGSLSCSLDCIFDTSECYQCGDGAIDPGENCDGAALGVVDTEPANCGNITGKPDGDLACLTNCTYDIGDCALCGDGIIEGAEECDDASDNSDQPNATCRLNCTTAGCGDGIMDFQFGEECDCGTDATGLPTGCIVPNTNGFQNACDLNCRAPICGDGKTDNLGLFNTLMEACDEGANNCDEATCTCTTECLPPGCGDGIIQAGEECDCGTDASHIGEIDPGVACQFNNCDTSSDCQCATNCKEPACGNLIVEPYLDDETCDLGAANCDIMGCTCSSTCKAPGCPNGAHEAYLGEECDLGAANCSNMVSCECNELCLIPGCGNGWTDFGEDCDQGAGTNCDTAGCTCSTTCQNPGCGNRALEAYLGESCDCGDDPANPAAGCSFANCDDGSWCECTPNCTLPWVEEETPPSTPTLRAVVVIGMEALAVGNHGGTSFTILARDAAGTWTPVTNIPLPPPPLVDLYDICAFGTGEVFVVGENMTRWLGQKVAGVWQFVDPGWAVIPDAGLITGVTCYGLFPNSYYTTADGRILDQTGNVPFLDAVNTPYRSVVMYPNSGGTGFDGDAVGDTGRHAYKYAASSWTADDFTGVTNHMNDIWADAYDFKIIVGSAGHVRISVGAGAFAPVNPSPSSVNLHSVTGFGSNVFAVGEQGTILHYDGTDWTDETALMVTGTFRGVSADGNSNLVIAVGDTGIIYRRP